MLVLPYKDIFAAGKVELSTGTKNSVILVLITRVGYKTKLADVRSKGLRPHKGLVHRCNVKKFLPRLKFNRLCCKTACQCVARGM